MKKVCLSDIAQIIMGQSPPSSTYNTTGDGLPFFQGKTDFGDLYPTARVFCSSPQRVSEPGDILISVRAPVGPTNISRVKSCIGRGLAAIRGTDQLDNRFLLYFLRYYEPRLVMSSDGSTFDAIGRDDLEQIPLLLPPFPEQQRIAAILEKADRLHRLRRYALETGETFLQAVFLEMFGDPVRNEKGWERVSITEIGRIQTGNTPSREESENFGEFIEWIKSDNILDNQLYLSRSREMLSEAGLVKGRSVNSGAVLMTCIAGSLSHIGDVAITNRRVSFNQQINAISPFPDVNPFFLYCMLTIAKPYIQQNASSGMKHIITKSKLEELVLVKPPKPDQDRFATIVTRYERLRAQEREAERQAEHLSKTLLHRAFNDQL